MSRYWDDELYHFGIKGMKWGVRRYQNEDGSLTPAGEKRYNDGVSDNNNASETAKSSNIIDRHRQKLIDKYMEKGYSEDAAKTMAQQRMRTETVLAVVGTVAVGVVASKAATRIGQDFFDKTIKSGTIIQNIGASKDATFKDTPFFAAINNHDKKAYGMLYPAEKKGMAKAAMGTAYEGIYNNQLKVTKDVKVPSVNNARKIFNDKMKYNQVFRKEVLDTIKQTQYGADADKLFKSGSNKLYDKFNQALATPEFQAKGIHKKFYDSLEKHGYNALLDINDTRHSGYKGIAKSPTIFYGKDVVEKVGSKKLSDFEIVSNYSDYTTELLLKRVGEMAVTYGAGHAASKTISDDRKIKAYLDEHPNSKMSRKEILKTVKGEKK